jgi:hypothetical protein
VLSNDDKQLSTQHSALSTAVISTAAILLFLATRLPLLFFRDFFYDEIFTRWIARKPFLGIVSALRHDSGPPLFYLLVHALGNPPLIWVRVISLAASLVALIALLVKKHEWAALFVAVFPPAVLFSVDARGYALCAMFVTLGVLALEDLTPTVSEGPGGAAGGTLAALAFVLAAYSHYYGVLFFPLLLVPFVERRASARRRFLGGLKAAAPLLLFAPGVWLAAIQPAGARGWMMMQWPDALFVRPPLLLAIAGAVALVAALATALAAVPRPRRQALAVLLPLALALLLRVYVPLRFESVIAAPLGLWLERGVERRPSGRRMAMRRELFAAVMALSLIWTALGIADHRRRPPDDYRAAAQFVAMNAGANRVVASGYLYLETVVLRPVAAFPPEQALHPGWRALPPPGLTPPPAPFWWVGERGAPELALIRRTHRADPVFVNARAIVVAVH